MVLDQAVSGCIDCVPTIEWPLETTPCTIAAQKQGGLARHLVDMSLRTILIDKSVPKVGWFRAACSLVGYEGQATTGHMPKHNLAQAATLRGRAAPKTQVVAFTVVLLRRPTGCARVLPNLIH